MVGLRRGRRRRRRAPVLPGRVARRPAARAAPRAPRAGCGCARSADFDAPVYVTSPPGDRVAPVRRRAGRRVMVVRDGRKLGTPFLDIRGAGHRGRRAGAAVDRLPARLRGQRAASTSTSPTTTGDQRIVEYKRATRPRGPGLGAARAADGRPRVQPQRRPAAVRARRPDVRRHRRRRRRRRPARRARQRAEPRRRCSARSCGSTRAPAAGGPTGPGGNPFVGRAGARGEIYSYGLRNPWRFSFDRRTGDLVIGDVGQNAFEEIDFVRARRGPRARTSAGARSRAARATRTASRRRARCGR